MRARDCSLKASAVTPPPWRQRIRGDERDGSGLREDIGGAGAERVIGLNYTVLEGGDMCLCAVFR
jgi:hypothetical protein